MPDIKLKAGNSGDITPSGLNGLTDGSANSTTTLSNDTDKYLTIDLMLKIKYASTAPTAGAFVAEAYLVPALDGTNFAAGTTPQQAVLIAQFESRNPSTSNFEYLAALHIPLPLGSYKITVINKSGRSLAASGCELRYRTTLQQG